MYNAAGTALSALEIAGSLCGVPYVGAAAIVLKDIVKCCNQVTVQKRKSNQLADRCTQLLLALRDQTLRLEGTELLSAVDEVTNLLEKIHKMVGLWSGYNRVKSFVKNKEIEDGLDRCSIELNNAMNIFQINSHILLHQSQRKATESILSDTAEMRELLYQILTSRQEMGSVVEMQHAGEHVAEPIMAAGQLEMRRLRKDTTSKDPSRQPSLTNSANYSSLLRPCDDERYLQYQRGLIHLHHTTGIPPAVKILNGEIAKIGDLAIAGGTYSDVWLGMWLGEKKVALKALRNIKASDSKAQRRFEQELNVWAHLGHEHILPFYGIVTDLGQHMHMVSPWQEHGNVLEYVKFHNGANRLYLLSGAAQGLGYLHTTCKVIHGNVKCANILVSAVGEACVCDFGMSKVIEEVTEKTASATLTAGGSARWLAPELIEGTTSSPTMAADTYSYAMAILELLTMKHPYAHRKRDASVIHDIVILKKTPPRPQDPNSRQWLTDNLWALMQECWRPHASNRPLMNQVADRIKAMEHDVSAYTSSASFGQVREECVVTRLTG